MALIGFFEIIVLFKATLVVSVTTFEINVTRICRIGTTLHTTPVTISLMIFVALVFYNQQRFQRLKLASIPCIHRCTKIQFL
jgi:hypothetical protein